MSILNGTEDEPDFGDYWKVISKRKKFIIGLILISIVMTAVVSILMPKIYRAEFIVKVGEGYVLANAGVQKKEGITTDGIIGLIGKLDIDNEKTEEIFAEKAHLIKALRVTKLKGFADKLKITIESENIGDMEAVVVRFIDHINNLPLVKQPADEDRKAIAQRLKDIAYLIKEYNSFAQTYDQRLKSGNMSVISFVPAELKQRVMSLDIERRSLEMAVENVTGVSLAGNPYISKTPVSPNIKKNIILTLIASLAAGVLLAFLVEYIEKVRNK